MDLPVVLGILALVVIVAITAQVSVRINRRKTSDKQQAMLEQEILRIVGRLCNDGKYATLYSIREHAECSATSILEGLDRLVAYSRLERFTDNEVGHAGPPNTYYCMVREPSWRNVETSTHLVWEAVLHAGQDKRQFTLAYIVALTGLPIGIVKRELQECVIKQWLQDNSDHYRWYAR